MSNSGIAILINLFCDRSVGVCKKIGWRKIERLLIFLLILPIYMILNFWIFPLFHKIKGQQEFQNSFCPTLPLFFIYIPQVIGNNKNDHWPFIDRPIEMSFLDKSDNFLSETKTKDFFFKRKKQIKKIIFNKKYSFNQVFLCSFY